MATIDLKAEVGNKVLLELDKNIVKVNKIKEISLPTLKSVKSDINNSIGNFSTPATIDSAKANIAAQAAHIIPDLNAPSSITELQGYIDDCNYLRLNGLFKNIGNLFKSITGGITDVMQSATKDALQLIGGILPEMNISFGINLYKNQTKDVEDMVSEMDRMINCLDSTFDVDVAKIDERIDLVNNLLDVMNMDMHGKSNKDTILQSAGLIKGSEAFLGLLNISEIADAKISEAISIVSIVTQSIGLAGVQQAKSGAAGGADDSIVAFIDLDNIIWIDGSQPIAKDVLSGVSWARIGAVRSGISNLEGQRTNKSGSLSMIVDVTDVTITETSVGGGNCDFDVSVTLKMTIGNAVHTGSQAYTDEETPAIYNSTCGDWTSTGYIWSVLNRVGKLTAEMAFKNALDMAIIDAGQQFTFEELDGQLT